MDRLQAQRIFFADFITASAGIPKKDRRLANAFASVPRERFVGPGPWKIFTSSGLLETPSDDPAFLYQDVTVSPALARKIAQASAAAGIHFLDAPVTGGTWGAEKGELLFMIGGEAADLAAARPILSAMGKKLFHLGPNGAGQTIKLAMNLILALQVDALAEALALVTRAGLQGEKLVEVLQSSMARSGVLDVKAPNLLKGEYVPSFPLRLMHKDLGLALDLANQLGVALPATAAARETYNYVKGAAKEDLDYSAVMKFWKR